MPGAGTIIGKGVIKAGAVLILYEGWRRLERISLVDGGSCIGVYRRGEFQYSFSRGEVTHYLLNKLETAKLFFFLVAGVFLLLFLLVGLPALSLKLLALGLYLTAILSLVHNRSVPAREDAGCW